MTGISFLQAGQAPLWQQALLFYLAVLNLAAFILYGLDKRKARRNQWRISEATLLAVTFLGGSAGALAGMLLFHHKTRKWKFRLLVPLALVLHIGIGIFILF